MNETKNIKTKFLSLVNNYLKTSIVYNEKKLILLGIFKENIKGKWKHFDKFPEHREFYSKEHLQEIDNLFKKIKEDLEYDHN